MIMAGVGGPRGTALGMLAFDVEPCALASATEPRIITLRRAQAEADINNKILAAETSSWCFAKEPEVLVVDGGICEVP